eukprot:scaffold40312_cov22-Tisochrysis_lutea.AAC.1
MIQGLMESYLWIPRLGKLSDSSQHHKASPSIPQSPGLGNAQQSLPGPTSPFPALGPAIHLLCSPRSSHAVMPFDLLHTRERGWEQVRSCIAEGRRTDKLGPHCDHDGQHTSAFPIHSAVGLITCTHTQTRACGLGVWVVCLHVRARVRACACVSGQQFLHAMTSIPESNFSSKIIRTTQSLYLFGRGSTLPPALSPTAPAQPNRMYESF